MRTRESRIGRSIKLNKDIILWGTGKIAEQYEKIILPSDINIVAYIDNNPEKWGMMRNHKLIMKPEDINSFSYTPILIACADNLEVEKQIRSINKEQHIISFQDLLREIFVEHIVPIDTKEKAKECHCLVIDNLYGSWGGAEDWCHRIGYELYKREWEVTIFEGRNSIKCEPLLNDRIYRVDMDGDIYLRHQYLVEILEEMRPFVFINIWGRDLLWAAVAVKKKYPNDVRIISSILNDVSQMYEINNVWEQDIDRYICISKRIADNLKNVYNIPVQKVFHKEPFIESRQEVERTYSLDQEMPIKVCFPCRLVKNQKRAHLIPNIIQGLYSEVGYHFEFNIVGEGECEKQIKEFVQRNKLDQYVKFWGKVSKDKLILLLNQQDVYLNISEYEGTSLTMLEALASGCVPVVTNVSGVEEYIVNKKNGFISEIENIDDIINNLITLEKNRKLLLDYGSICEKQIRTRCQLDKYIDFLEDMICQI